MPTLRTAQFFVRAPKHLHIIIVEMTKQTMNDGPPLVLGHGNPKATPMNLAEKKLLSVFKKLALTEQENLQAYGEFLLARHRITSPQPVPEPQHIPRGENESVVAAIKRLSASYSMLDKPQLLNESSVLMTQHVMQGRAVDEVIEELETLFACFYQELLDEQAALHESLTQENP